MGGCCASHEQSNFHGRGIAMKDLITFKEASIEDFYSLDESPIGIGSISIVKKAIHKLTGQVRAIKILDKNKVDEEKLRKEIKILKNLDHPNILKVYEVFYDAENFYVISELCTGKELFENIEKKKLISEEFSARIMKELLSAIHHLHNNGVAHLNLKPESLRFENDMENSLVKITNFANAENVSQYEPFTKSIGTPEYMTPEIIEGLYSSHVDIWACGVILYIMLCGKAPFTGRNAEEMKRRIKEDPVEFNGKIWNEVSEEAKDLIKRMLAKEMTERITAGEAIEHGWFRKNLQEKRIDGECVKEILGNLKKFRTGKKIQGAIWTFMMHYITAKEDKEKLLNVFDTLDTDHDGQLSKVELKEGYRRFSHMCSDSCVEELLKGLDKNGNEQIDYTEFVGAVIERELVIGQEKLKIAFKLLDRDGNGRIDVEELRETFGKEAVLLDDEYWKELIGEADKNGDGEIDFGEFVELMENAKI